MYNPESVLENEEQKLLWDFEIQTDHQISARRPRLISINNNNNNNNKKDNLQNCRLCSQSEKECAKRVKYLDNARELRKLWNMKVTIIPLVIGALGTVTKGFVQGLEDLEIRGRVETIQTSDIEIGQNTEKSSGDLKKLVFPQNPVRNHQLTLVWKALKRELIIIIIIIIRRLHLSRGITPLSVSVLDMTTNHLMVRLQSVCFPYS